MNIVFFNPDVLALWKYVWEALAAHGACDTWGSVEQIRITAEWVRAGKPVGVAEFIIAEANRTPEVKT